jgi:hypothetical protein
MTVDERYDLAMAVDTLPVELLAEVIEILVRERKIKSDERIFVTFRELDPATLRMSEACVKNMKEKETHVKRMRASGTQAATVEQRQAALVQAKRRIETRLKEKHPTAPSGDGTGDTNTSDDGTGTSSRSDDDRSSD